MAESDEQIAVVTWFRYRYPNNHLIAIPSGQWISSGSKAGGKWGLIKKYKKEGWFPGVSDLFLAVPKGRYAGLWLEMKDRGKTRSALSKNQKKWIDDMREAGYAAELAAGADKAIEIIDDYMNQT